MQTVYYLPNGDVLRLSWLTNFNNKLVATYGSILGLSAGTMLSVLNDTKAFTYIMSCITASENIYHSCTTAKDLLNVGVSTTVLLAFPSFAGPGTVPTTTVPPGIFDRIIKLVEDIKQNAAYNDVMGADLGVIGSAVVIDWTTAQPTKLKVAATAGMVQGSYLEGLAGGARIESKRGTETTFSFLTNVSLAKFIDNRPNLVAGTPETREYRIWYLLKDVVVGLVSVTVKVTVDE